MALFGLGRRQNAPSGSWRDPDGTFNWSRAASGLGGFLVGGIGGARAGIGINDRLENRYRTTNPIMGNYASQVPNTSYSPVTDFQQNIPSYTDNLNGANLGFPASPAASQPAAQQPTNAASNAAGALGQAGMRGAGAPTPVNARGRTPQQEAEYAAALQFQAQMAVNRYSQDIGLQNYFSAGPEER